MDYDASYKTLFSHPQMVADLLRGFVREPWVAEADFTTLEKMSGSYVSDDLRAREDDVIWRVRLREGWLYVYLLLEFQSEVDSFMAVRVMTYVGLLYQDLIRGRQFTLDGQLPPIMPVVLYNGRPRWNAMLDVAALIAEGPGGLAVYRPHLHYLLIDEGRFVEAELPLRNLVAALFQLENSREPEDVRRVVERLVEWLATPEQTTLRRAFTVWINQVLLPARLPGVAVPAVNELKEVRNMLAERVVEWTRDWKEQGLREGLQEGLQLGEQRGSLRLAHEAVLVALEVRFGAVPGRFEARVNRIEDLGTLRVLHKQAILAGNLMEFERVLMTYGSREN